eukprot:950712_1
MALARNDKLHKLTAKFAFIDRNIRDTNTEKLIAGWGSFGDTMYCKELEHVLQNEFKTKLKKNRQAKLKKLVRYINLYLETHAFRKWLNTEYLPSSSDVSPYIAFDSELETCMGTIKELLNSKRNAIALLKQVTPFDERKQFEL